MAQTLTITTGTTTQNCWNDSKNKRSVDCEWASSRVIVSTTLKPESCDSYSAVLKRKNKGLINKSR